MGRRIDNQLYYADAFILGVRTEVILVRAFFRSSLSILKQWLQFGFRQFVIAEEAVASIILVKSLGGLSLGVRHRITFPFGFFLRVRPATRAVLLRTLARNGLQAFLPIHFMLTAL